jgi:hypothetical protein
MISEASCTSTECPEFEESDYSDSHDAYLYCFMCKPFLSHLHKDHEWYEDDFSIEINTFLYTELPE